MSKSAVAAWPSLQPFFLRAASNPKLSVLTVARACNFLRHCLLPADFRRLFRGWKDADIVGSALHKALDALNIAAPLPAHDRESLSTVSSGSGTTPV